MAYIGNSPDLNESVGTAQIADDAVTLAKMASGTDGALITYDTSGNPVAITGNDGQVATSAGANAVSAFESITTGKILQVVSTHKSDTTSSTSKASSDAWTTVMSVSITPSSSSNKVLFFGNAHIGTDSNANSAPVIRLIRDSTAISIGDAASNRIRASSGYRPELLDSAGIHPMGFSYLDSPSTTSSTTYGLQLSVRGVSSFTAYLNRSSANDDNTERQRPASTITVTEVSE